MAKDKALVTLKLDCGEEVLSEVQLAHEKKCWELNKEFQRKINEICEMVSNQQTQGLNVPSQPINSPSNPMMLQNVQPAQMNGSYVVVESNNQVKLVMSAPQPVIMSPSFNQMVTSNAVLRMPTNTTATASMISHPTPRPLNPQQLNRARPLFKPRLLLSKRPPFPIESPTNQALQIPLNNFLTIQESPVINTPTTIPAALRPAVRKLHDTAVIDLTSGDIEGDESLHVGGILPALEKMMKDTPEKTFPSLVVVARAHLKTKDICPSEESRARILLDSTVKKILVLGPTALTEWLLQQKLIRSSQKCLVHGTVLKLGMYSDASRLPYSGGYVWVSECCPSVITSVFSGSIFESAPYAPTLLLKLIYHWACQTTVQNVLLWVKVGNLYIKTMYTNLRAVCTAIIHQHFPLLGGKDKIVEVGLISLGHTTRHGVLKQVKVEVLGIYEEETKRVRLKAMEPLQDRDKLKRKKFIRILEPLQHWVDKDSIVVTDICATDPAWKEAGFNNVRQSNNNGVSNQNVMAYIRNIVPRMFQNTLSLLSRPIIQQFLDELVWRETWGPIPALAHETIISNIAEMTGLDSNVSLANCLAKISSNPFRNWKFDRWNVNCMSSSDTTQNKVHQIGRKKQTRVKSLSQISSNDDAQGPTGSGMEGKIYLESYYYGIYDGENISKSTLLYTECAVCLKEFRDNIQFADHLILHALNQNYPVTEILKDVCNICLTVPDCSMNAHINEVHKEVLDLKITCRICNLPKKSALELVHHMTSKHNELELPYTCEICFFRTSIFDDVQTHFNTHHKNCCSAQCPFCLKVVNFVTATGEDIVKNQHYFIRHIQRHQLPFARKCDRCALSFINTMTLRDHQEKKHMSCKAFSQDIRRYPVGENGIIMKDPSGRQIPIILTEKDDDTVYIEEELIKPRCKADYQKVSDNLNFLLCRECDGPMVPTHFTNSMQNCPSCKFSTYCSYAYCEHVLTRHGSKNFKPSSFEWFEKNSASAEIQDKTLHCAQCLFTSTSGNEFASHLVLSCPGSFCTTDKRKVQLAIGLDTLPEITKRKRKRRSCFSSGRRNRSKKRRTVTIAGDATDDDSIYSETVHSPSASEDGKDDEQNPLGENDLITK